MASWVPCWEDFNLALGIFEQASALSYYFGLSDHCVCLRDAYLRCTLSHFKVLLWTVQFGLLLGRHQLNNLQLPVVTVTVERMGSAIPLSRGSI